MSLSRVPLRPFARRFFGAGGGDIVGVEDRGYKHSLGKALRETGVAAKIEGGEEVRRGI